MVDKRILIVLLSLVFLVSCSNVPRYAHLNQVEKDRLYSDFLEGKAKLESESVSAAGKWGTQRRKLFSEYNEEKWELLAKHVLLYDHPTDLAYFYLGRAAEGLGYYKASIFYYQIAKAIATGKTDEGRACDGIVNTCNGFTFPNDIDHRLSYIRKNFEEDNSQVHSVSSKKTDETTNEVSAEETYIKANAKKGKIAIAAKDFGPELVRRDFKFAYAYIDEKEDNYVSKALYISKYQIVFVKIHNNSDEILNINPNYFTLVSNEKLSYPYSSETHNFKRNLSWLDDNALQHQDVYPDTFVEGFLLFEKKDKNEYPVKLFFKNPNIMISVDIVLDKNVEYKGLSTSPSNTGSSYKESQPSSSETDNSKTFPTNQVYTPPSSSPPKSNCHWVNGYHRKDGTYVRGHIRCR